MKKMPPPPPAAPAKKARRKPAIVVEARSIPEIVITFTGNLYHASQKLGGKYELMDFPENHVFSLSTLIEGLLRRYDHHVLDLSMLDRSIYKKAS